MIYTAHCTDSYAVQRMCSLSHDPAVSVDYWLYVSLSVCVFVMLCSFAAAAGFYDQNVYLSIVNISPNSVQQNLCETDG